MLEKELITFIRKSFEDHDLKLNHNQIIYTYVGDLEREEIQKFYYGKTWEEVLNNSNQINNDLTFMLPIAIAQYIPAFMIYCIDNPNDADTLLESLSWFLLNKNTLARYKEGDEKRKDFFSYLSQNQKECIKEYLYFMFNKYPEEYEFLVLDRLSFTFSYGERLI